MLRYILYPFRYIRRKLYQLTYNIRHELSMYRYMLDCTPADAKPVLLKELIFQPHELERRYWEEMKFQRRMRRSWRRRGGLIDMGQAHWKRD